MAIVETLLFEKIGGFYLLSQRLQCGHIVERKFRETAPEETINSENRNCEYCAHNHSVIENFEKKIVERKIVL